MLSFPKARSDGRQGLGAEGLSTALRAPPWRGPRGVSVPGWERGWGGRGSLLPLWPPPLGDSRVPAPRGPGRSVSPLEDSCAVSTLRLAGQALVPSCSRVPDSPGLAGTARGRSCPAATCPTSTCPCRRPALTCCVLCPPGGLRLFQGFGPSPSEVGFARTNRSVALGLFKEDFLPCKA